MAKITVLTCFLVIFVLLISGPLGERNAGGVNGQKLCGKDVDEQPTQSKDLPCVKANVGATTHPSNGRPRKDEVVGSSHTSPHVSLPQKRPVGQLESPTTTKTPQCHGTYNDPYGIGHSYDDNRNGVIGTSSRHSKDNSVNLLSSFDDVNDSESHEYGEDDMIDDENEIDENVEDFSNSEDAIENDTVMSQAHRDDMINDENGEEFANSEDAIDNDIVASDAHREYGFHKGIKYKTADSNTKKKRKNVTLKEYHSYQLHIRPNEGMTLRYGGRLYQQKRTFLVTVLEHCTSLNFKNVACLTHTWSAHVIFRKGTIHKHALMIVDSPCIKDDIIWMRRRTLKNDELMLSEEEIHHWALAELERILNCIGKSLRSYADMPFPPPEFLCGISNTLIAEERSYDIQTMMVEHQQLHSSLNADQMIIYDAVIESVYNKRGKVFFVYGEGNSTKNIVYEEVFYNLPK
ncbi:hypothetical protein POM88_051422 [Heracleum sosnowskyi]|uniref:ATP-dependent DNA helicase n=1 Tax=Heracleum sosnowskyi TaxID=360622 RepID=A0AAD8H281_9APIA|nr:hypothetical protein POM88_051422 [Heracleum sosnowskyi]